MKNRPPVPIPPLPVTTLIFPDGTTIAGSSDSDAIERLARIQWTQPYTSAQMKSALSDRVWAIGRYLLDPELPDGPFLDALDESKIVRVQRASYRSGER